MDIPGGPDFITIYLVGVIVSYFLEANDGMAKWLMSANGGSTADGLELTKMIQTY